MNKKAKSLLFGAVSLVLLSVAVIYFVSATAGPVINSVAINDTDNFYSNFSGNNIIHISADISGVNLALPINAVFANFSALGNIDCGNGLGSIVNMTNDTYGGNIYNASCNVGDEAAVSNFAAGPIIITAISSPWPPAINLNLSAVLYNMTGPQMPPGCQRFGNLTTNFVQVPNFNSVNFIIQVEMNGSCLVGPGGGSSPWNGFQQVMMMNFSSLNMSSQTVGSRLAGLKDALQVNITPPNQFGTTRIYLNSSAFAELNTNTTITLANLPFASLPIITSDNSSENASSPTFTAQTPFYYTLPDGHNITVPRGTLTFNVIGFSGYNATDIIKPVITLINPTGNVTSGTTVISALVNGTGTSPSYITISLNASLSYSYNSSNLSQNTAGCVNISSTGETLNCTIPGGVNLGVGNYTFNVSAWDYGGTNTSGPGNYNSSALAFSANVSAGAHANPAAVDLGNTSYFAVLSKTAISDSPNSTITGDVGISPAAGTFITGLTCPEVNGTIHVASAGGANIAACNVIDPTYLTPTVLSYQAAYTDASGRTPGDMVSISTALDGLTLTHGVYTAANFDLNNNNNVTLDCGGDSSGVFIFHTAGHLNIGTNAHVNLIGNCQAKNIFWAVAGTTNILGGVGTESTFEGTVLGGPGTTEISLGVGSIVHGRLMSDKTISLLSNIITVPAASSGPSISFGTGMVTAGGVTNTNATIFYNVTVSDTESKMNLTINIYDHSWNLMDNLFESNITGSKTDAVAKQYFNGASLTSWADGLYYINASVVDYAGNSNRISRNFTIDTHAPTITLNFPNGSRTTSSATKFNWSVSDALSSIMNCTFRTASHTENYLVNNGSSQVSSSVTYGSDGTYTWNVSCFDVAGNTQNSATNILVYDTTAPTVTLNAPANNSNLSSPNVLFNITAIDNLDSSMSCNLTLDGAFGGNEDSVLNGTSHPWVYGGMTQGAHNWSVNCTDDAGNTGKSQTRRFVVDSVAPAIIFGNGAESDGANLSRTNIVINATASDSVTGLASITVNLYNSSGVVNSTVKPGPSNYVNITSLADGVYYINATAQDYAGNVNRTAVRRVTIDTAAPILSLTSTAAQTSLSLAISAIDTTGLNGTCTVNRNGGAPTINGFTISESGLTCATSYTYNVTCYDYTGHFGNITQSFSTSSCSSSTSSGGGGGSTYTAPGQLSGAGLTKTFYPGEALTFTIAGATHSFLLLSISYDLKYVTVQLASAPQKATMAVGDEKKFDLNNDSYYDVDVRVNNISRMRAEFTIKTINESTTASIIIGAKNETTAAPSTVGEKIEQKVGQATQAATQAAKGGKGAWIFWIITIIVLLAVIYFIVRAVRGSKQ